ncbi:UxaA family hydrolase [Oceanobacillus sp. J11TS1]|uniref:UxaA family hydrolase n=1 Tax=Oceanobacillus sp. J11TS1 TaxID=2807191 RepID=UPI001B27324E|nr:UxaA family hydrolase [Oceanobacillus sp. J11TS1]GIO23457.1 hypothetical protein J11TS1_20380 [Oceanobacillus sp. J11TS1]
MNKKFNALQLDKRDNVAVVLETVRFGQLISVQDEMKNVNASTTIPYGHKVALVFIPKGEEVIKYGECMGIATADIAIGDHVHVSNVRGLTEKDKRFRKEEINFENI